MRSSTLWRNAAVAAAVAAPGRAAAHPGRSLVPGETWSAWTFDPWVLLGLGVAAWLYARGAGRVWGRAGVGRGLTRGQFWSFCGGLLAVAIAMLSPVHALGGALFAGHMLQHELLILAAAPLLVFGAPWVAMAWALPKRTVSGVGRALKSKPIGILARSATHPIGAWTVHAVALWVWHAPVLYQATLTSDLLHLAQHASFLGSAILFWWVVAHLHRRPVEYGIGVLMVFTTMLHSNALGALLTFSGSAWYPMYEQTAPAWGFSALEDQQLGGLLMWVPAGAVYLVTGLTLLAKLLQAADRRTARVAADVIS